MLHVLIPAKLMLKLSKPVNNATWHLKDTNGHVVANVTLQKSNQTKQFCMCKVHPTRLATSATSFMYLWDRDMILSSPCPSMHLWVTLLKDIQPEVPCISLAQKLQGPLGVPCDGEGEGTPDCLYTIYIT